MNEVKMPSHIRIQRVNEVVEEIKTWMHVHKTVKYSNEKYTEGVLEGLNQALAIIEKNIYLRKKG